MKPEFEQHVSSLFFQHFSYKPELIVQAPGRINLIGEHTDYNNGFVLPAAIDKKIYFAFAKNNTNTARVVALDKSERYDFPLSHNNSIPKTGWQKFVYGMSDAFLSEIHGYDCVFGGDLPLGAGMSSSSALCCGLAYGLNLLFDFGYSKEEMTPLIQQAEAKYSGVNGGIMDQFTIMMGRKNEAILLDCQNLHYEYQPLDLKDYCLLLCNTNVAHELAATEYNTRRAECESGILLLQNKGLAVKSLRDVSFANLEKYKADFDPVIFKRCAYVVRENDRVHQAVAALRRGDLHQLGSLLYQSHDGLQWDYEVSCPELDFLVAFAKTQHYVLGARMMGGGFGGCTLNLLPQNQVAAFLNLTSLAYFDRFGIRLSSYEVLTGDGVSEICPPQS
jgi:galactokinase